MKPKIKELINTSSLEDVYLTGFIDIEDGIVEFYPDMRFLYFKLGEVFIELQSIEQFSKLQVMITDSVLHKFEIDSDMYPAKSSIDEVIFVDPSFYYGIGVGGVEQKECWQDNHENGGIIDVIIG